MIDFSLSPVYCANNGVLLLEKIEDRVLFGVVNHNDTLCNFLKKRYIQYLKNFKQYKNDQLDENLISFKKISKEYFIRETSKNFAMHTNSENTTVQKTNELSQNLHVIEDTPIVNLLNSLILECAQKKGSDIHIEPFEDYSKIRMRVLGDLEDYTTIDKKTSHALLLRILFLANLNITESRRIQDGSFEFISIHSKSEVRVSILPSQYGASIVLRLLQNNTIALTFKSLGFNSESIHFLNTICTKKSGLTLICGSTGAGKSTTLAAVLKKMSSYNRKIITIEDPVEYRLDNIVQIPIKPEIDMDFSQVLKSSFRHDPDVIMIGEIRDEKTAQIAVRAALTGHLVLASIHSFDAPSAIIRLLDIGIEPWLLSSVFGGVFYQELHHIMESNIKKFIPSVSILPPTDTIKNLIYKNASLQKYSNYLKEAEYDLLEVYR